MLLIYLFILVTNQFTHFHQQTHKLYQQNVSQSQSQSQKKKKQKKKKKKKKNKKNKQKHKNKKTSKFREFMLPALIV